MVYERETKIPITKSRLQLFKSKFAGFYFPQGGSDGSSLSLIALSKWLRNSDSELLQRRTSSSLDSLSSGDRPFEFLGEQFGGGGAGGRSSSRRRDRDLDFSFVDGLLLSKDLLCSVSLFRLVGSGCTMVVASPKLWCRVLFLLDKGGCRSSTFVVSSICILIWGLVFCFVLLSLIRLLGFVVFLDRTPWSWSIVCLFLLAISSSDRLLLCSLL